MDDKKLIQSLRVCVGNGGCEGCQMRPNTDACMEKLMELSAQRLEELLPCKVGDRVWGIRLYKGAMVPREGIVTEMYYSTGMRLCIVVGYVCRGEWGKNVFATQEAARAEIDRRKAERRSVYG